MIESIDAMLKLFMETGPIHDIEKFETALREQTGELRTVIGRCTELASTLGRERVLWDVERDTLKAKYDAMFDERNMWHAGYGRVCAERDGLRALLDSAPLLPFKIAPHGPPVHKPKGPRK